MEKKPEDINEPAGILAINDVEISEETRKFVADVTNVEFSKPELVWVGKAAANTTVGDLKESNELEVQYSEALTEKEIAEINARAVEAGDWALISVLPFATEESLTVTMKTGEVFTIKVTDRASTNPQNRKIPRNQINVNNRDEGIILKLFDYSGTVNNQNIDAVWGNSVNSGTLSGGTGVNSGRTLVFSGSGLDNDYWYNNFTGSRASGMEFYSGFRQPGIVKDELVNGYPELSDSINRYGSDDGNLDYLFKAGEQSGVTEYSANGLGLQGLLRRDSNGYYYYSSEDNYARYDNSTGYIDLYTDTYFKQNGQAAANNNGYGSIGFFPFTDYNSSQTEEKGPNTPYNLYYNHQLGMSMSAYFTYPPTGRLDNNDAMIFEFSGDDDVWVFVDGKLAMDLGGVHQPIRGVIDFAAKEVRYYEYNSYNSTNSPKTEIVTTVPFSDIFGANGFDDDPYSTHKIDFFFLERGGCDSNCELTFNLQTLRTTEKSFTKKEVEGAGLKGAVFTLYTDEDCTQEVSVSNSALTATSDNNGTVTLTPIPIRRDRDNNFIVYYMKETHTPFGYKPSDTVYKLVYNRTTDSYDILTLDDQPAASIVNEPADPISLSVQKQWQDAAGNNITPENSYSATFKVNRLRSYVTEDEQTTSSEDTLRIRHVANDSNWSTSGERTYKYLRGRTVTISYDYHGTTSNNKRQYRYSTNGGSNWNYSDSLPETGSFDVTIPASGQYLIEFYDVNNAVTWTIDDHAAPGQEITDQPDPTFSCDTITLTNGQTSGTFNSGRYPGTPNAGKFPLFEEVSGVQYTYKYYITEESRTPSNALTIYLDGEGNVVAEPSALATIDDTAQNIVNRTPMDVPIEKYWPDFNDAGHSWTARFQLQYRLLDPDTGEAVTNWADKTGVQKDVSSQESGQGAFTGLPMYQMYEGKLYRIEYSVAEIAYTARDLSNNSIVAQWQDPDYYTNPVETIGAGYSPQFVQDAGEHGADLNDYKIIVANTLENRVTIKKIDLSVHKIWPGTDIADRDDAEARFVLKRYVYEEYRDFPPGTQQWVDITLDTGNGSPQALHVPKNWQMTILGNFRDLSNVGNIVFHDEADDVDLIVDPADFEDYHFYKTFIADQTKTIRLTGGAGYAAGGANGIRLSDMDDPAETETSHPDNGFAIYFTLNKDNNWQDVLYNLPVIEEDRHTEDALNITRHVYGYYIEEISCVPEDYAAKFKDSQGILLGDEEHTIDFSSSVTAENRLKPGSILLTKKVTVNGRDPAASSVQFVDDTYYFTIAGKPGTDTAGEPVRTVSITITNGQAETVEVENLTPGQYVITEVDPANGTELVGENGVTAVVVTDMTGDATPESARIEMTNNRELTELKVRKQWAASSPADHPANVNFKVYRIGYYMDGDEQRPASEGFYPDNSRTYTIQGTNEAHVPNLPLHGVESVAGIDRWVTYEYRVVEMPVSGDVSYWPTYSQDGDNTIITNTPVEKPDHVTDVSVSKTWLDKDGNSVPSLHENDEIEFALKEIPHNTGYVPVHLVYINADGTTWKQQEVFVKYNERLSFTFRKGNTLRNHQIDIVEGNRHTTTGGTGTQYTYQTNRIINETTITLTQTFSQWALLTTYYDRWGDTVESLGLAYQWTSNVVSTEGTLYTDYETFYNTMKDNQGGDANELFYTLSRNDITGEETPYEGEITGDWAAIFEDLPEFQKVGDEYVLMTYEISELKIKPAGMDEEPVGSTSFEGYQGETTNYLVNWVQNGDSWTITNREKPGLDITIRKTDDSGKAIGGAVFEIYKETGSVYRKLTHSDYDWIDENNQFTADDEGFMMTGLKDGRYQIKEVLAPEGYIITNNIPVEFELEHCAVVVESNVLADGVTYEPAEGSAKDTYIIPNIPGAALPHTGGPGTEIFTILGSMLILGAAFLLWWRRGTI